MKAKVIETENCSTWSDHDNKHQYNLEKAEEILNQDKQKKRDPNTREQRTHL